MDLIDDDVPLIKKNIYWQYFSVDKQVRAKLKNQIPVILWFTGLSASGKSTIANTLERELQARGQHTFLLDGDNIRHGLNKDLGFTDVDRAENIRRIAETAKLMLDAGLITIVSCISPFEIDRQMARDLVGKDEFIEIYIKATLELCVSRDPKGLYKKAQNGELMNFTGIDSSYDIPQNPDICISTGHVSAIEASDRIFAYLEENGYISL